jgi:hypothetical protein
MTVSLSFRVQSVRLDYDTNFRNQGFIAAYGESHSSREHSAPYRQFQNGLIERKWNLFTLAQCVLDYASLSPEFEELAMAVAVHILSCTFRRGVNDIPLRLLPTPSLSYLRNFGC